MLPVPIFYAPMMQRIIREECLQGQVHQKQGNCDMLLHGEKNRKKKENEVPQFRRSRMT